MSRFSRITAAKIKRKIRISNRHCLSKFPRKGSKTKYEKKNLKSDLWPGYWYFSWLRTKIDNWKICHRPISAVNMKIFLWLARKKSITENFAKRKLHPLSVSVMVQRFFSSWALSPTRCTTFWLCGLWNLQFHFFKKSTFLPSKGLLYLRDKQNNRWSLADMELLFSCLSRYQEIITVYILLLDTLLFRCSRSRDNKLNIWREIPYQSAPKYYCLFIEWVQNSRVCHTASIQNPLKVTIFNEFQCVTVARSLSDRFS